MHRTIWLPTNFFWIGIQISLAWISKVFLMIAKIANNQSLAIHMWLCRYFNVRPVCVCHNPLVIYVPDLYFIYLTIRCYLFFFHFDMKTLWGFFDYTMSPVQIYKKWLPIFLCVLLNMFERLAAHPLLF